MASRVAQARRKLKKNIQVHVEAQIALAQDPSKEANTRVLVSYEHIKSAISDLEYNVRRTEQDKA